MRASPEAPWRALLQRHELVTFFALAYAVTAVAFGALVIFPGLPFGPFWLVGVASPTIVAVVISGLLGGQSEIRLLLSGFTRWRIGWRWYLVSAVFVLGALALAIAWILIGNTPDGPDAGLTVGVLLGQLAFTFLSGPLAEEAGWRGFALPRMQARYGALWASVMLGLLWAFWHVPMYFLPGSTQFPFPIFVPQCVALAIIFTWIYNNTRGSLVATVLTHFGFNFSGGFLAGSLGLMPPMLLYIGGGTMAAILTVVVIVIAGPRYLSRRPRAELPIGRPLPAEGLV